MSRTPVLDSEYFTFEEFATSRTHPDLADPVPQNLRPNVEKLVVLVLDPIRYLLNQSIVINSGYRSTDLNIAVGGSKTSQHLRAEAVDFTTERIRWVFRAMVARPAPYQVGQVIYYPEKAFVHLALPSVRYPKPSFHVHWPEKGLEYHWLKSRHVFDELSPP